MSSFKEGIYELADANLYDKPVFSTIASKPNVSYVKRCDIDNQKSEKADHCFRLLVAATIVNFVLILVIGAVVTYFITKTATKSEVGSISQSLSDSIPTAPPQGMKGDMGLPGAKGDNGTIGQKGERGEVGLNGTNGSPGPAGIKGNKGRMGSPGEEGEKGSVGPRGAEGNIGPPGQQGVRGVMGAKGTKGVAGLTGTKGRPGSTGSKGEKGSRGVPGEKGDRGIAGMDGGIGPPGIQGAVGPAGQKGEQGATGRNGAKGDVGAQGLKGEKGIAGPAGPPPVIAGGATYVRWGRSICRTGVQRLYAGRTGATFADHQGGASNYICMPPNPDYNLQYRSGTQGLNYVLGTEYEDSFLGRTQHNSPCALCYLSTKQTTVMIPAKTSCPSGWTVEYIGYLMSETHSKYRTMYICVDTAQESIPGTHNHADGGHLFNVEGHCSLGCPPYNTERELGCVVCSR